MKTEPKSNTVIRVSPAVHRMAKIQAAEQGCSLVELVNAAIERELKRRAKTSPATAAALAEPVPIQTR